MRTKSHPSTRSMSQLRCWIALVAAALPANAAVSAETHPLVKKVQQIEERLREHEQALLAAAKAAEEKPDDRLLQMRITAEKLNLNATMEELRSAREERDDLIGMLKLIQQELVEQMAHETDNPSHVLHAALGRLELVRCQNGDWIYAHHPLMQLAAYRWPVRPGDDLDEMAARFADFDHSEPDPLSHRFRDLTRELEALQQHSQWDWERTGRDFWLRYVATLFRSELAEDAAAAWREQIEKDPAHADLYRAGYLEIVREKKPAAVDAEILRPLLPAENTEDPDVQWAKSNEAVSKP